MFLVWPPQQQWFLKWPWFWLGVHGKRAPLVVLRAIRRKMSLPPLISPPQGTEHRRRRLKSKRSTGPWSQLFLGVQETPPCGLPPIFFRPLPISVCQTEYHLDTCDVDYPDILRLPERRSSHKWSFFPPSRSSVAPWPPAWQPRLARFQWEIGLTAICLALEIYYDHYARVFEIIGNANGWAGRVQDECRSVNLQCIVGLDTGLRISTIVVVARALLSVLPLLFLCFSPLKVAFVGRLT